MRCLVWPWISRSTVEFTTLVYILWILGYRFSTYRHQKQVSTIYTTWDIILNALRHVWPWLSRSKVEVPFMNVLWRLICYCRERKRPGPNKWRPALLTYECGGTKDKLGNWAPSIVSCQTTKVSTAGNRKQFARDLRRVAGEGLCKRTGPELEFWFCKYLGDGIQVSMVPWIPGERNPSQYGSEVPGVPTKGPGEP